MTLTRLLSGRNIARQTDLYQRKLLMRKARNGKTTDSALVRQAIDITGMTQRQFARSVLLVNERTIRNWLGDDRIVRGPFLVICRAIVDNPRIWKALARAAAKLKKSTKRRRSRRLSPRIR